jgi:putative ABC transport system permease protein
MHKTHFTRVMRNFSQNRFYASINFSVLVIGISSSILVTLYLFYLSNFDAHHEKADRIFRLATHIKMGKGGGETPQTPACLGPMLKREQTFIENYVRFHTFNFEVLKLEHGDKMFKETGIFGTEPSIFSVFTHPMLAGSPEAALKEPKSIVFTESLARKYFGATECLGKTVKVEGENYSVTGVIEDPPANSDLLFQALISHDFDADENWDDVTYLTYVVTDSPGDGPKLEKALTHLEENYIRPYYEESEIDIELDLFSTPLRDVHFTSGMAYDTPKSNYIYVYIFLAIGFFMLSITSFNYINLATVQSFKRSKEVGVKGVLGVRRWQIVLQFVSESLILTLAGLSVSLILIAVILPHFNTLAQTKIMFAAVFRWKALLMICFVVLLLGVISAVVPALYLTSFALPNILKGKLPNFNRGFLYRGLLVAQFSMAIIMIICTLAVYQQMQYMRKKNLGFLMDKVMVIDLPEEINFNDNSAFKKELLQYNSLAGVSLAGENSIPGSTGVEKSEALIEMENQEAVIDVFNSIGIDENYLSLLGIELIAGKNFDREPGTTNKNAFIVNEAFVKYVGWKDPINKEVGLHNGGIVIGVVKDYNYKSLHNKIEPLIMHYNMGGPNNEMLVKIQSESDLDLIGKVWKKHFEKNPLYFTFLNQSFDMQYQQEKATMAMFFMFSVLVIILTCLGLFGLSSLITRQRVKEIGIRKILGGTEANIIYVLLKDIVILLCLSIFVAVPIAQYGIGAWQTDFTYQARIGVTIYVLAWALTLGITLLTTFYHTFNAVRINPAIALKHE